MTKPAKLIALISLVIAVQTPAAAASQTITFDAIPNQIFGVAPFFAVARASSGLPVTFVSMTATVCKADGSQIILLAPGSCSIAASQAGNGTFDAASTVTRGFNTVQALPAGTLATASALSVVAPDVVLTADFNRDGIRDLATVNETGGKLTILLGDGSGAFSPTSASPVKLPGSYVVWMAEGDFNGDGIPDLVYGSPLSNGSSQVTLLAGDGAGGFTPTSAGALLPAGTNIVAVGDLNNDGVLDLVVAAVGPQVSNQLTGVVTVLLGNGTGGFSVAAGSPINIPANATSVAIGDFDGDGNQDVIMLAGTQSLVLLAGYGTGAFHQPMAFGQPGTALTVADFNGDGIDDIAVGYSNTVQVILGGSGGLTWDPGYQVVVSQTIAYNMAAGDFDGDGIPDLAVGGRYDNVILLFGKSGGGFTSSIAIGLGGYSSLAAFVPVVADFNGDGREDLVAVTGITVTTLVGGPAPTGTVLNAASPAFIDIGQSVTLTATVSDTGTAFGAPTGTVTFLDGTTVLGTASQTSSPYSFTAAGLSVGPHTLSAMYSGDTRSLSSISGAITIQVVVPVAQSITFNIIPDTQFVPSPIALTATASSGLLVLFSSTTPAVCKITANNAVLAATLVGLGTCSITASQAGNVYYNAAPNVTQSFNVTQGTQTILFDAVPNQIFGISPFPVTVQATSGLPMTIVSTTTSVCRNASNLITLVSPGLCTITASQAGNANYTAAASVTRSFNVSPGTLNSLAKPSGGLTLAASSLLQRFSPAIGDLNGDGKPDLANPDGQTFLGDGSGSFVVVRPRSLASASGIPVLGDFNGDGIEDLASVGGYPTTTVNILLGTGNGQFTLAPGSPIAIGSAISGLAVGDFNDDGIQDLAALSSSLATVTVLLGNGTGGFTPAPGNPFALGASNLNPEAIAVGDFNGDGIADIVTANQAGGSVSLLIGNGSGVFALATGSPFSAGPGADSIVVGDFNGDGFDDVATADSGAGVTVLLGTGAGSFSSPAQYTAATSPNSLAIADLNGDGIEDLAVAGSNQVVILLGNGSGAFTLAVGPALVASDVSNVQAADFNADGTVDLVAHGDNFSIFIGGPAPTSSVLTTTSPAVIDVGQSVPLAATISDVITYNPTVIPPPTIPPVPPTATSTAFNAPTGTVTILDGTTVIGTSTQSASPYSFTATGLSAGSHTLTVSYPGDSRSLSSTSNSITIQVVAPQAQSIAFNALPDIPYTPTPISLTATALSGLTVTFSGTTPGVCAVSGTTLTIQALGMCSITASQTGNVYYTAAPNVTQSFTVSQAPQTITFDAIPNQLFGISPFLIAAEASSGLAVSIASSTPSVCSTVSILVTLLKPGTCSVTATQIGNVNYSAASPVIRTFTVSKAVGAISYAAGSNSPIAVKYPPDAVAVGDFNGDGIPDIVTILEQSSLSKAAVLLGDGKGAFNPAPGGLVPVGDAPTALVVGDFNGDGYQDIAVANHQDGNITLLLGDGSGAFTPASGNPLALPGSPQAMVAGDFNGDGIQDLAVSAIAGVNGVPTWNVFVLLGSGQGSFTSAAATLFNDRSLPFYLAVGDFNGDGKQDIVGVFGGSANIVVMLGNGSGGFTTTISAPDPAGKFLTSLAVGDFNGDGVQDLAVVDALSNNVRVFLGNGLGAFSPAPGSPYAVGSLPESIVAADFNGDGITDLAVSNMTGNSVTLLTGIGSARFTSSTVAALVTGETPSFLAAADFNGDGIEDIVSSNFHGFSLGIYLGQPAGTTPQTITFAPLPNIPVATASFTLTATSDSGLTVAFTSNTPAICTVSGTTLAILTAGNCSITATQPGSAVYAAATPVTQRFTVLFGDVAPTDSDYAAINAMSQHGITAGCGSNNFCPNQNVTRDEMAIFIVRAIYGNDNFTYSTTPYFTDVQPTTFGFKWIQKLKDLGITNGCTATSFCPGAVVARDQMAIFIIRARLGLSLAGSNPTFTYPSTPYFTDATSANEFAFPWIQRMKLDSITNGCSATTYCPSAPVTRGEMAIFIMRGAFNQFLPAGTPVITQISPSTIASGTSGTYTIIGVNTNFVQGLTQLSPIPGVSIGSITVTSATTMTVQLSDTSCVPKQPCSLLVTTGSEQAVLPNGLLLQ